MPLLVNLRLLEDKTLHLRGELPSDDLELEGVDELIHLPEPLHYELEAQRLENQLLVQGTVRLELACECARCLKPFRYLIAQPWVCHAALEGEGKVESGGDVVDLTPYLREDMLLAFPQHPLCESECGGLPDKGTLARPAGKVSAWDQLNKLKF